MFKQPLRGLFAGVALPERLISNARTLLLGAVVVSVALALSGGASGKPLQAVEGKAVILVTPRPAVPRGWLAVSSLAGADKRPLTPPLAPGERRDDFNPTWSPDGTRVAFARKTPGRLALMVISEDGSGLQRVATLPGQKGGGSIASIRWSPDGARLAYMAIRSRGRPPVAIYVASVGGSVGHLVAALPRKPDGYLSLFGWSPDSSRVTYSFTRGDAISLHYTGPAWLKTVRGNGRGRKTVLVEDAIDDASWAADGSLIYVRHCLEPTACQLAIRHRAARRSRPLTRFGLPAGTCCEWDDLEVVSRPQSSDIVYSYGRKVYEVTPATGTTHRIVTVPCPRRRCRRFDDIVYFVGVTGAGRYALIEDQNDTGDGLTRDYSLDLETGALARLQLITADPAAVFVP